MFPGGACMWVGMVVYVVQKDQQKKKKKGKDRVLFLTVEVLVGH